MSPFTYPETPHVRRHGPQGYTTLDSYRPWLRDEFSFRCVYCLSRETWGKFSGEFAIDHFIPESRSPGLALSYDNLLYSCVTCNAVKGARAIPDPCRVLISGWATVDDTGVLNSTDRKTLHLIKILNLNSRSMVTFRKLWIEAVRLAQKHDPQFLRTVLGYPANLPNLAVLQSPCSNTHPGGLDRAYALLRERGELPEVY